MRTLGQVVYIFDRDDVKEWELSPLRDLLESRQDMPMGLTPGAEVVDAAAVGLEGIEGESMRKARLDRAARAGNTAPGIRLKIPTPNPTTDG